MSLLVFFLKKNRAWKEEEKHSHRALRFLRGVYLAHRALSSACSEGGGEKLRKKRPRKLKGLSLLLLREVAAQQARRRRKGWRKKRIDP